MKEDIICWWSGGVTSAVAVWLAIQIFGIERCRIIFIDTFNEHKDTYRFKDDCERWYGKEIETITAIGIEFQKIQDVWMRFKNLQTATGANCSTYLKRRVREKWEKENPNYTHQVFGFDISEASRAISMKLNNPHTKPIFPLLFNALTKKKCIEELQFNFIPIPIMYFLGFHNNNCFGTGCVQGGIGYWQKMFKEFRIKFLRMAVIERWLSDLVDEPVTINKDQSKMAKKKPEKEQLVFLVHNPKFPNNKCLADFKPQKIESLMECSGFCGTNDLKAVV
ncbi:phosphoadenosine phosphosulfate reductase family protein [Chryseobacterium sp. FH1]|uniref:phosphoadenosine phosphosulfate reductase domain-containing protein n=1 Tax=Chryseobacterium sp. FH1 TaxID=1233951 RepID=UPI00054D17AE|nr:phosphoadenosine phosphosulfate reductase family protein [Chryseobacterium sp. FH1]